jgi:T-complex protein 1 subunit alpha
VENKCLAVRRVPKDDLRRIAKASGASMLLSLTDENGEDSIKPDQLGSADEVWEETLGDDDFIFFKNVKKCQSIVLRGANTQMVDEIERSLHDSICMVKRVLQSSHVVAGGGAVEVALSTFLEDYARSLGSRE